MKALDFPMPEYADLRDRCKELEAAITFAAEEAGSQECPAAMDAECRHYRDQERDCNLPEAQAPYPRDCWLRYWLSQGKEAAPPEEGDNVQ